jgi:hypothetical protein
MVTVVDAANFARELAGGDSLVERHLDQYSGGSTRPPTS